MKKSDIFCWVVVGLLLVFLWHSSSVEFFQDTEAIKGPPYTIADAGRIVEMMPESMKTALRQEVGQGAGNPAKLLYPITDLLSDFHSGVYARATAPLKAADVDTFLRNRPIPPYLTATDVKTLLVAYFVNQAPGSANATLTSAQTSANAWQSIQAVDNSVNAAEYGRLLGAVGQTGGYMPQPGWAPPVPVAPVVPVGPVGSVGTIAPTCPTGRTFNDGCKCCVDGPGNMSAAICPAGYGLWGGQCVAGRSPAPNNYWLPGGGMSPPQPIATTPATCPPGFTFSPGKSWCTGGPNNDDVGIPQCSGGGMYTSDLTGQTIGTCSYPQGPPSGAGGPVGATQHPSVPPAFTGLMMGGGSSPGLPKESPLVGEHVGGPMYGGMGVSTSALASTSGNWSSAGSNYPTLIGPGKKNGSNLPNSNSSGAGLTLPTACQVGADGNTMYMAGCRAPTELGAFAPMPAPQKMDGDPLGFLPDYRVFMK